MAARESSVVSQSLSSLASIRNPSLVWVLAHRTLNIINLQAGMSAASHPGSGLPLPPSAAAPPMSAASFISRIFFPLAKLRHPLTRGWVGEVERSVLMPGIYTLDLQSLR